MNNENETKEEFFKRFSSLGGKARWGNMSEEERKDQIKRMVKARKKKQEANLTNEETLTQ